MLYRIAIYKIVDGKRVFDHYASDEMKYLRPMADGRGVETINTPGNPLSDIFSFYYEQHGQLTPKMWKLGDWQDVSDTHEVEWGFEKEYYVGDMIESKNEETIFYDTEQQCFAIGVRWLELRGENGETEVMCDVMNIPDNCGNVIGNIHEEEK
jgi:hypothetical protein